MQPTNSGIDFQQRVSAWFLINLMLDMDISNTIDLESNVLINLIAFETDNPIDDLFIKTDKNHTIFFQIKRTVYLSSSESSDLFKALNQFVKQFLNRQLNERYVLVVSNNSSSKISVELRKILESIRLNPLSFIDNPLSIEQKHIFKSFKELVNMIFIKYTSRDITDGEFTDFIKRVIISVMDIEEGGVNEKAAIVSLIHYSLVPPKMIWSLLITKALSYAANRLSVTKEGLLRDVEQYLKLDRNVYKVESSEELLFDLRFTGDRFQSGREIILVENNPKFLEQFRGELEQFFEEKDKLGSQDILYILEIHRFDEQGNRKLKFYDKKVKMGSGVELNVICRSATYSGIERFLTTNERKYEDMEIITFEANDRDGAESSEYSIIHSEWCQKYVEENQSKFTNCYHCGKGISENKSLIIEIDSSNSDNVLGLIHEECLEPIDRILGIQECDLYKEYPFLRKFDYNLWIKSLRNSQGMMNQLKTIKQDKFVMLWNPDIDNGEFNYCIKIMLEDGSYTYSTIRGKVHRVNKSAAKKLTAQFNGSIFEAKQKGNPLCYSSNMDKFAEYSQLLKLKLDNEKCIECTSAEMVKYTAEIGNLYSDFSNYYTPIITINLIKEDEFLEINNQVVMLSDPLTLDAFFDNWCKSGISIAEYELNIISSDSDFDNLLRNFYRRGKKVVIDPIIDSNKNLIKGVVVENILNFVPTDNR